MRNKSLGWDDESVEKFIAGLRAALGDTGRQWVRQTGQPSWKKRTRKKSWRAILTAQSAFSRPFSGLAGSLAPWVVWFPTTGLRRCSFSRALIALRRSRNQVFSGHCQF